MGQSTRKLPKKLKTVAYICGRFSNGDTLPKEFQEELAKRFDVAMADLYRRGYAPLNPIANDQNLWATRAISYDVVLNCDLAIIKAVHDGGGVLYCLKGWQDGHGSVKEWLFAKHIGMRIMYQRRRRNEG